jgi:hypothetical protein
MTEREKIERVVDCSIMKDGGTQWRAGSWRPEIGLSSCWISP